MIFVSSVFLCSICLVIVFFYDIISVMNKRGILS